jgi:hypothetical protein
MPPDMKKATPLWRLLVPAQEVPRGWKRALAINMSRKERTLRAREICRAKSTGARVRVERVARRSKFWLENFRRV